MTKLFAEHGVRFHWKLPTCPASRHHTDCASRYAATCRRLLQGIVGFYDYEESAVKALLEACKKDKDVPNDNVHGFTSPEGLLNAFKEGKPRVLVLSLPHGSAVDSVIDQIAPLLNKGDIVVDCGNEWWESTERRQKKVRHSSSLDALLSIH